MTVASAENVPPTVAATAAIANSNNNSNSCSADKQFAHDTPEKRGKKLLGREFYKSIGSPKMVLAPMVDRSEFVS